MLVRPLVYSLPYLLLCLLLGANLASASAAPYAAPPQMHVAFAGPVPLAGPVDGLGALHADAMAEIRAYEEERRAAYEAGVEAAARLLDERRAALRADYQAKLAAWRERCGVAHASAEEDPFAEDDCRAERHAILVETRRALRELREEQEQTREALARQLHAEVEAFARAKMDALRRAVEEASYPDPFAEDARWAPPPGSAVPVPHAPPMPTPWVSEGPVTADS